MMHRAIRYARVALLLVGSAILLSACHDKKQEGEGESKYEALMTEYSENRTIIASENGVKQYQFFAPLLEGYTAGKEPYREFRKGIRMTTFKKDSSGEVDVTLTANYAIYYENRKLWEAKGDVVVRKFDGKELYTEQLFWNDVTNKIYSNVDSKIVEPDGETYVSGFESDEEFRYWSAREMDGRMQMEFTPTQPDSTAVAEQKEPTPEAKPANAPSKSASTSVQPSYHNDKSSKSEAKSREVPVPDKEPITQVEARRRQRLQRDSLMRQRLHAPGQNGGDGGDEKPMLQGANRIPKGDSLPRLQR